MLHVARRALRYAFALCCAVPAAGAQELRGTVLQNDGAAPATGVIIEAQNVATGQRVASTLTDARGFFILRLPQPGQVSVRALRIGQRPTPLGEFTLGADEVRAEEFRLTGETIVLARVSIVGRSVCGVSRDSGLLVATLLDEARKVLRATQLTSTADRLTADWVRTSQLTTLRGEPITDLTERPFRTSTDRPFVSLSPDSLAKVGYFADVNDEYTYHAPDAEVLLSESFVEGHCFQAEPWHRDARDWVGLGFRPASNTRGVVGIGGTLWLDRQSAELRLLEYRYVNLPREVSGTPAGGEVEFLRLPSGAWLVHRWRIRMPRPTVTEEPQRAYGLLRGTRRVVRIKSMEVAGGEVRTIRAGERVLYASGDAGEMRPVERSVDLVNSLCESPAGPREGVLWGVVRDAEGAPVPQARLALVWRENARWLAEWQRTWQTRAVNVTAAHDGFWYACGVPRGEPVTITVGPPEAESRAVTARIPATEPGAALDLTVAGATSSTAVLGTIYGTVFDSLRREAPWVGAEVRVVGGSRVAVADIDGRFALDSLPPGEHELAAWDDELLLLRVPPPTVRVRVAADGQSVPVRLATPAAATYFSAVCGRAPAFGEGVLVGEVRDLAGARRAGVTVRADWARTLISATFTERDALAAVDTTDATGAFVLCGLPLEGEVSKTGDVAVYASGEVSLSASGTTASSGTVAVRLDGTPIRRRDLIVGGPRDVGTLSGRVLNQFGQPIPDATIVVGAVDGLGGLSTRSDSTGRWTIAEVPVQSTQIVVRALRYTPFGRDLDPLTGRLTAGEIRLEPAAQLLTAQVTTARGGMGPQAYRAAFDERKRSYGFGTFIDDAMLERQPVVTPQFLIRHIPKARHATHGALAGKSKIGFEVDFGGLDPAGAGAMSLCFPRWFVDGTDFGVPEAEEEEMWLRQAKRVEIYKASLAPPQYNDFRGCGVILIWTR